MPMTFGARSGDKPRANTMNMPNEGWLWDKSVVRSEPGGYINDVPKVLPPEVSMVVSISGKDAVSIGQEVVEFRSELEEGGDIIRKEEHRLDFRREFDSYAVDALPHCHRGESDDWRLVCRSSRHGLV
jgi:hypothetical protein